MRVIDPKQRQSSAKVTGSANQAGSVRPTAKKRRGKQRYVLPLALLLVVGCVGAGYAYSANKSEVSEQRTNAATEPTVVQQNIQSTTKTGKLKTFTGEQFRDTYDNFAYPNTAPIDENTPITGNVAADHQIKHLAEQRGYKKRSAPVTNTFQDVGEKYQLQQRAAQPWLDMQAAAKKDGINLGLTAAYRAANDQKDIFLQRLSAQSLTPAAIASGSQDAQVNQVLRTTAIPGYSRHHTGYTVDISCKNQPANAFENTVCFQWLSANNYQNAKKYGWIPSYPPGAGQQGPDPESWEYVWVGIDTVTE